MQLVQKLKCMVHEISIASEVDWQKHVSLKKTLGLSDFVDFLHGLLGDNST